MAPFGRWMLYQPWRICAPIIVVAGVIAWIVSSLKYTGTATDESRNTLTFAVLLFLVLSIGVHQLVLRSIDRKPAPTEMARAGQVMVRFALAESNVLIGIVAVMSGAFGWLAMLAWLITSIQLTLIAQRQATASRAVVDNGFTLPPSDQPL